MLNKYKHYLIAIFTLVTSLNVSAQKVIVGSKAIPQEFNLLLENLHLYESDAVEKIRPSLFSIDYSSRSITPEDLLILIKIEIYKTFLKNYDTPIKTPVDGKSLETLNQALKKANDRFMKWFILALLKDSQDLISNPTYKEFLLQKNVTVKIEKNEYRKVEKKAELLQAWISKLNPEGEDFPDNFKQHLALKMLEAISNIQNTLQFIVRESTFKSKLDAPKTDSDLKLFSFKDYVAPKNPPETKGVEFKSVEDILSPITEDPMDLPAPVKDDWTNESNLPKPTNDAEWLEDF